MSRRATKPVPGADRTMDETSEKRSEDHGKHRRTRRLSIFLILATVAAAAIGIWVFSSWYTAHYGSRKKLEQLPPPSLGSQSSGTRPK